MKISAAGVAMVARFEGCKMKAYRDAVGVWTIGYGHTSAAGPPQVTPGLTITRDQAKDILANDLAMFESGVDALLRSAPTQGQYDAMVSFAYNVGLGNFAKSSVLRLFNAGDETGAAQAFGKWTKAGGRVLPGLVTRRAAEAARFMEPT
jgi:lysozyme